MVNGVSVDYYPPPEHSHSYNHQYDSQQEQSYKYHHSPHHQQHHQPQPHHSHHYHDKHEEYEKPVNYEFGYSVHDEHTGDIKSQTETRNGDTVQGRYELIDPDGYKRIVEYTADAHNGFNAVVRREPTDIKIPVPQPKTHQHKYYQPVETPKYYAPPQPQPKYYPHPTSVAPPQVKYYAPPAQPKYFAPSVKSYSQPSALKHYATPSSSPAPPMYYAAPRHPKYYKPTVEKTHDYTVFTPAPSYYPSAASPQQVIQYAKSPGVRQSVPMASMSSAPPHKYVDYPNMPNHVSVETPQVKYQY